MFKISGLYEDLERSAGSQPPAIFFPNIPVPRQDKARLGRPKTIRERIRQNLSRFGITRGIWERFRQNFSRFVASGS